MKKKQIIGIAIAIVIFVAVGGLGVLINNFAASLSDFAALKPNTKKVQKSTNGKYIQKINITGEITSSYPTDGYDHNGYLELIDDLMEDDKNKGIYLYIDSPGGEAYASDIMYQKLMQYRRVTNRPVYTYIGSMCASGGYYIASASNMIYSGRSSWVGSIGCYVQMVDISGLEKKIGIDTFLIKSGKNKGAGTLGEKVTSAQKKVYQSLIDDAYEIFLGVVKKSRKFSDEYARKIADGRIYTANQSIKNKLIDGIMEESEFIHFITKELKTVNINEYEIEYDFFQRLFEKTNAKSDIKVLVDLLDKNKKEVLMYYVQ